MYNPQLETFLCVAECGSFNKAAEKLFISPPAVIKQINLLEENLDLQLFVRTHRGLQLTEAGKSLAQDAKYIIQYCKDSVTRAKNVMKKSEDIIRIGTSSMTHVYYTHLRAHETVLDLVCRLLLEKNKKKTQSEIIKKTQT